MKFNKRKVLKKIKQNKEYIVGAAAGVIVTGVAATLAMKTRKSKSCSACDTYQQMLGELEEELLCSDADIEMLENDVDRLTNEVTIRDCVIMEGIDGDREIYARRMAHFRDWNNNNQLDDSKSLEESREYGFEAECHYENYLSDISGSGVFKSEIPVITEDTELPF